MISYRKILKKSMSDMNQPVLTCRACLEKVGKLYPLEGFIPNVDVNISTMITYITSLEVELHEDLPSGVCIPCFRTIRISFNFILQYKDSYNILKSTCQNKVNTEHFKQTDQTPVSLASPIQIEGKKISHIQQMKEREHNLVDTEHKLKGIIEGCIPEEEFEEKENKNYEEEYETEFSADKIKYCQTEIDSKIPGDIFDNDYELLVLDRNSLIENPTNIRSENKSTEKSKLILKKKIKTRYRCPKCPNLSFVLFEAGFVKHILTHENETFSCKLCPLNDKLSLDTFLKHFAQIHRFQCPFCGRSFSRKGTLYSHMKAHTDTRYTCSHKGCMRSFLTAWSLKKHVNIHNSSVKHVCSQCGLIFKTYDTFRYHLKKHSGRNFLCTFCGKTFVQSVHLKYHMWTHTGIKQFTCDLCSKSYTSVTQMKKHKRMHHY